MLEPDRFVEVQGTGEHGTFSRAELDRLLDLADGGITELFARPAQGARLVKLLVGTRSAGKQREVRRVLEPAGIEVVFPDDVGLCETPARGPARAADSFETNARQRPSTSRSDRAAHRGRRFRARGPLAGRGAGRPLPALGRRHGHPGRGGRRQQRRAAAPAARAPPEARRRARYRCVLVSLRDPAAVPEVFEGACGGSILEEPRGTGGFGYDPLFLSDELGKTFGEATAEEKDAVSHRGRALRALAAALGPSSAPASDHRSTPPT